MNPVYTLLFILPFGTVFFVYLYGAFVHSRRRGKAWPRSRTVFGIVGVLMAVVSATGPLAHLAHADFRFHMGTHLILGMLSPLLIHLHIFLAGYVYTASLLQLEPSPDRYRFSFRAAVLVLSLAAHQILAKFIYAHPLGEVPTDLAEAGGMLMYYGGDVIDLVIIIVLCRRWYQTLQPRKKLPSCQPALKS